jgi:aminoglycoside 3-N-acetyltransferase
MMGVGFDKCTALHLAEARSGRVLDRVANGAPMRVEGERRWVEFTEPAADDTDFVDVGRAFVAAQPDAIRVGRVGLADTGLVSMPQLVDFAAPWIARNRQPA